MAEDDRDVEDDRAGDQSDETLAARRDMSFSERLRAPDAYGLLLVALGAVAILAGVVGSFAVGRVALVALLSGTLLFAFRTSRVSMRAQRVALVSVLVAIVAVAIAVAVGSDRFGLGRRGRGGRRARVRSAGRDPASCRAPSLVITGTTVAGAACAYLLIGMFFASLYTVMAGASAEPFFAQTSVDRAIDQLYFSFVTLTTVGYGDLTATGDLGRMIAASEALIGQLFLVVVVALVVGNIGRERR